jgi:L-alanine-DL-glutamate epimerase-like enolase superfamily enzyme
MRIELHAGAGSSGSAIAAAEVVPMIEILTERVLDGQDPRATAGLWERMTACETALGSADHRASAALDIALWDLKAQRNEEPLWRTIGGDAPRANAYVTVPAWCADDGALAVWCRRMQGDFGLRGVKLVASGESSQDRARLQLIAAALEPGERPLALMVDFGGRFDAKESVNRLRELERTIDLTWVEAAAHRGDFLGSRRVSNAVRAAVCAPRGLNACGDYLSLLQHRAVDVVQLSLDTMGITGALRIADAAFGYELPVTIGYYPGNLGVQLAGALPYLMNVEVAGLVAGSIRDGWAQGSGERIGAGPPSVAPFSSAPSMNSRP